MVHLVLEARDPEIQQRKKGPHAEPVSGLGVIELYP